MTEERKPAGAGQDTDDRVTRAYRELATERAPDHLDRAVLGKARAAARPRYWRLRLWTRPLAWAATVMLSVAIVLQIGEVPGPEGVGYDEPASELREEVRGPEVSAIEAAEDQAAPEPALEKRQRARLVQEPKLEQEPAAPEAEIDAFAPRDADMLQRAAEMARTQTGENRNSAPQGSADSALALSSIGVRDDLPTCDETATRTPEAWLKCITELEEAGFSDAALLQRELLRQSFPDFEAP